MSEKASQRGAVGKNRTGRKLEFPNIPQSPNTIECVNVAIPKPALPFFRIFFERMYQENLWKEQEDYERAINCFSQIEAEMFVCNAVEELKESQNLNICTLIAFLVPIITKLPINPASAMFACGIIRDGLASIEGSVEWDAAVSKIIELLDIGVGQNTDQMETYGRDNNELLATLNTLIGGDLFTPPIIEDPT